VIGLKKQKIRDKKDRLDRRTVFLSLREQIKGKNPIENYFYGK
jgi:hypothetical protein